MPKLVQGTVCSNQGADDGGAPRPSSPSRDGVRVHHLAILVLEGSQGRDRQKDEGTKLRSVLGRNTSACRPGMVVQRKTHLDEVRVGTVQHARPAQRQRGCVLGCVDALTTCISQLF